MTSDFRNMLFYSYLSVSSGNLGAEALRQNVNAPAQVTPPQTINIKDITTDSI